MTHDELLEEVQETYNERSEMELELERLTTCYLYASAADKKVIWAVLNKYVPFLTSLGLK